MRHGQQRRRWRATPMRTVVVGAALLILASITVAAARHGNSASRASGSGSASALPVDLPHAPMSYIGVYANRVPGSYAGVAAFAKSAGAVPDIDMYYSGWYEPFEANFARTAAQHGAVPLVQIEPRNIRLSAIASGQYDGYLTEYAAKVRAFRRPVILSFGHEMNGSWYSWGYQHSSPKAFVAAWRHIVHIFREMGADNVTWLWTVNIIDRHQNAIPDPAPWWPGSSYVTWVGIDGYYVKPSWTFAPLFGPTIAAVRQLTHDPILVGETGATPAAGKAAKVANLFAGIRAYGLLGFVWYDVVAGPDWRIDGDPAALAAFRRGAQTYKRPS